MPDARSRLSPTQSALRFLIELGALAAWGIAGWHLTGGPARWPLAIGLPLAAAIVWGTFRVPGDESANGAAAVPVPGIARLTLELDVLLGAAIAVAVLWSGGGWVLGGVLAVAVASHYLATLPRVKWLIAQRLPATTDR